MVDTPLTLAAFLALTVDGQRNAISAQFLRELALSVNTVFEVWNTPSYADEAAAIAGGVGSHGVYRNGNIIQVRLT